MFSTLTRVAVLALLGGAAPVASASNLRVSGAWGFGVDAADLVAGAGSPLQETHDSPSDQVSLDVSETGGATEAWVIRVYRDDVVWRPELRVYVRRTGDGAGLGSVSGGLGWVEVGAAEQTLFEGTGDRLGVGLQFRVVGVDLDVPIDSFATSLVYTVVSP